MKNGRWRFGLVAFAVFLSALLYLPVKSHPAVADVPKNALQGEFHLSNVVKIYVPSKQSDGVPIDEAVRQVRLEETLRTFSAMFGGATAIEGEGAWVDDGNNLVRERVTIVYSFALNLNDESIDQVVAYARAMKTEMNQSAVTLEVNGKMYFIE